MKTLIIQTSPHHTASTFLINALYGIIPQLHDKKISKLWDVDWEQCFYNDINVVKNHYINIEHLTEILQDKYKLFFICSEREEIGAKIDIKYKSYENVIIFNYNELNETDVNTIPIIVNNIYNKLIKCVGIDLDKELCIDRINKMNICYNEIKNKPFSYIDPFYELHGSHRNRTNHS